MKPPSEPDRRYVRPPVPIHFPSSETVPETKRHLLLRTALFDILSVAFGDRAAIGSEQFVYYNALDPNECVSPDVMVRLGHPNDLFDSWKTWERGAPHVAVEVLSERREMARKLRRYHEMGVEELVAFDPEETAQPLRIWTRVDGDLVERELGGRSVAFSDQLGVYWMVVPDAELGVRLGLARDEAGKVPLPTRAEAARERAEAERERAEARVRELEKRLAERDGRE